MALDPLEYALNRMENAAHSPNPSGSGYAAARVELLGGIRSLRSRCAALEKLLLWTLGYDTGRLRHRLSSWDQDHIRTELARKEE